MLATFKVKYKRIVNSFGMSLKNLANSSTLNNIYYLILGLPPSELIEHGEQETEWGGYFVIGGHERIIRILQVGFYENIN